ncbi:MAG: ABC transporter permease subunit [Candidatus Hodarchaeales archaeon]|jgi:simple sugar transport system permease protein
MSLRTGFLQAQNRLEGILIAVISFLFALISLFVFLWLLNITGTANYDFGEIIDAGFLNVIWNPGPFVVDWEIFSISIPVLNFDQLLNFNWNKVFNVIHFSSPLVLTGLAVAIAFRAGLFNIGGTGQMIMGGAFAGIWAAALAPAFMHNPILMIPSTIVIGMIAGAIWGFIPGLLKAYTGAHEVITTIMLNIIAGIFTFYLVNNPFLDTQSIDAYGQTDKIVGSARIPLIFPDINTSLNWTIIFVVITVIFSHFLLYKTNLGYKIRAVGLSATASESAGIDSKRTIVIAMTIAGAIAGLAGTFIVMGLEPYRYRNNQESTFGFDGIAVALIGQNNPFPLIFGALIFGFLRQSGQNLELTRTPPEIILIFQAIIILFVAIPLVARKLYSILRQTEGSRLRTNVRKWFQINKGLLLNVLIIISILFIGAINEFIFKFDIFRFLRDTITPLTDIFSSFIPLLAFLVVLLPIYYGGRRYKSFVSIPSTDNRWKNVFIKIFLVLLVMEAFLLLLYVLNTIESGYSNPLIFHFEVWADFVGTSTLSRALALGIPLVLAAIGATFNERAGVINIGLEGIMLFSAWGAVYFTFASGGNPYIGVLGGLIFGGIVAFLHALWSVTFKGEQIVAGVAINLLALGLTDLFTKIVWVQEGSSTTVNSLPKLFLSEIPLIGDFLNGLKLSNFYDLLEVGGFELLRLIPDPIGILASQSVLVIIGILIIPIFHYLLFHTTFGLRIRVIGEDPQTAATAGISVRKYQYIAVVLSGLLAALGGMFLSIGDNNFFRSGMTNGKGFISLAAMIFGKWTVTGSALGGFFFGYFDSLSVKLAGDVNFPIEFFSMLPFIITVLVLAGFIGRARPPKDIGKPYDPTEE